MAKKHFGKLKNTDQRVAVVYLEVPGKEDHALIIELDGLNVRLEQAISDILNSAEGQAASNLGDVMGKRYMADTKKSVLQEFHDRGKLRAEPQTNIMLYPVPNNPMNAMLLSDVMKLIKEQNPNSSFSPKAPAGYVPPKPTEKFNQYLHNDNVEENQNRIMQAKRILQEANGLHAEASQKENKAYALAPELRGSIVSNDVILNPPQPVLPSKTENANAIADMFSGKKTIEEVASLLKEHQDKVDTVVEKKTRKKKSA